MLADILEKIQECKAHIDTLCIRISGETRVTTWFRELCSLLTEILFALTKYIKSIKPVIEKKIKENVLLYLMQLTACLSLVIKIFLREHEVGDVISEARHCILKQLTWCLEGLSEMLTTGKCSENVAGSFIKWMDASLDKLGEVDIAKGAEAALKTCQEVKPIVEEVLCHAMSIAQVGLEEDCKIIKGASHTVLETIESLMGEISKSNPNSSMVNLFVDCCCDKLCLLERKVNTGVLQLTLQVFSEYTTPLENLFEYCFNDVPKTEEKLDSLIADFDMHVDRIMQIGLFAVACSTDADRCIKMRSCLASLEALEGELVPSFTAVSIDKSVHNVNFALLLKGYWVHQSQMLKELIYLIIDPTAFCQVAYDRIKQTVMEISEDVKKSKDYILTDKTIKKVTDKADVLRDMIRVAMTDMPAENMDEVKSKYKDFIDVLHEVKVAVIKLLNPCNKVAENDYQRVMKRCKILLTTVKVLLHSMSNFESMQHSDNNSSVRSTNVKNDNENIEILKNTSKDLEKQILLEQFEDKGKLIVKERSVLYKTPTKLSMLQKFSHDLAKSSELPLSRLVHFRKLNFCAQKPANNETNIELQITDILNDLTTLSCSVIKV